MILMIEPKKCEEAVEENERKKANLYLQLYFSVCIERQHKDDAKEKKKIRYLNEDDLLY